MEANQEAGVSTFSDNSEMEVPGRIIWHCVGPGLISASEVVFSFPLPLPLSFLLLLLFLNKNNYEEFKMPFFHDISALRSQQHIGGKECPLSLWLLAFI